MPIYEYVCTLCSNSADFLQKVDDPAETCCPHCGKSALTKKISSTHFQLKGSGWYATDFRDKPKTTSDPVATTSTEKATSEKTTGDTNKKADS